MNGIINGIVNGTWTRRGLVLLAAAPLLGVAPPATEAHGAGGVTLHTAAPKGDVQPGRAYAWTFTVAAKGPAKSAKAVFRATLPRSLEFVSGEGRCRAKGQKVACRLGTLAKGREVKGVLKAKVSSRARGGQRISLRGTATWGKARATRRFPAVRVAGSAGSFAVEADPAAARTARATP